MHVSTERYGQRGIKVCNEWLDYKTFREWAEAHGYEERLHLPKGQRLSIERIDPDGNYEPSNCEWVTLSENVRRSSLHRLRREQALRDKLKTLEAQIEILRREVTQLKLGRGVR